MIEGEKRLADLAGRLALRAIAGNLAYVARPHFAQSLDDRADQYFGRGRTRGQSDPALAHDPCCAQFVGAIDHVRRM